MTNDLSKKRLKIKETVLEMREDGKAGIVYITEDGREFSNLIPPFEELAYDDGTALNIVEI